MNARVEVGIFDTTCRDGAQALPEKHQFPAGSKVEIANAIAELGVRVIEAGFPRTEGDAEEVDAVARSVGNRQYETQTWRNGHLIETTTKTPIVAGLCRAVPEDILTTWLSVNGAIYPRIHTFIPTNAKHIEAKLRGKSQEQVLEMARLAVAYSRDLTIGFTGASVEFSAEATSTTDMCYLERVVKTMINEGADIINLPDTVGERDPFWMRRFYGKAIKWIMDTNPEVVISAHNHNDGDMATANSLALVMAAMDYAILNDQIVKTQVETTVCGIGERVGNTDVFPVVAGLFKFCSDGDVPVVWQFNPGQSVRVANTVMNFAGLTVDRQNPIVGADSNVHRAGIHSDGVIEGGYRLYTPHDPTFWGHKLSARHEDGKYQGKNGRRIINLGEKTRTASTKK